MYITAASENSGTAKTRKQECTMQFDARIPTKRARATPSRHLSINLAYAYSGTGSTEKETPGTKWHATRRAACIARLPAPPPATDRDFLLHVRALLHALLPHFRVVLFLHVLIFFFFYVWECK